MGPQNQNQQTYAKRIDDWIRWALGLIVAALLAYGAVGSRITALETAVKLEQDRAREDRDVERGAMKMLNDKVDAMRATVEVLRAEMTGSK